jgi:hypothetical protein
MRRIGPLLLATAAVLLAGVTGCGGASTGTTGATTPAAKVPADRCDARDAEGELYSAENDLRGIKENLRSALAGSQTVPIHPGGHARIRSYSTELLQSIDREVRDVRKILQSC